MAEPEMKRQDNPLLKRSDKGPDVTEAQDLLNRTGAILDPDGDFGGGTEDAVREFQAINGIPVTGIVDSITWRCPRGLPQPSRDRFRPVRWLHRPGSQQPPLPNGRKPHRGWCQWRPSELATISLSAFEADWAGLLTGPRFCSEEVDGVRGDAATAGPSALAGAPHSWMAAWTVFIGDRFSKCGRYAQSVLSIRGDAAVVPRRAGESGV
jgi:hypothetical protein